EVLEQVDVALGDRRRHPVAHGGVVDGVAEVVAGRGGGQVDGEVEVELQRLVLAPLEVQHADPPPQAQAAQLDAVGRGGHDGDDGEEGEVPDWAWSRSWAAEATRLRPSGPSCRPVSRSVTEMAWGP